MNALANLFNGVGQIYLNVAFIFAVFGILAFKPDRITKVSLLKLGCLLFCLSLIVPMIGALLPGNAFDSTPRAMPNNSALGAQLANLFSTILYATGFFITVLSVLPNDLAGHERD